MMSIPIRKSVRLLAITTIGVTVGVGASFFIRTIGFDGTAESQQKVPQPIQARLDYEKLNKDPFEASKTASLLNDT
jgi:hypothetical protein